MKLNLEKIKQKFNSDTLPAYDSKNGSLGIPYKLIKDARKHKMPLSYIVRLSELCVGIEPATKMSRTTEWRFRKKLKELSFID